MRPLQNAVVLRSLLEHVQFVIADIVYTAKNRFDSQSDNHSIVKNVKLN